MIVGTKWNFNSVERTKPYIIRTIDNLDISGAISAV